MATYRQIIIQACEAAKAGFEPNLSPLQDLETLAQSYYPQALRLAMVSVLGEEAAAQALTETKPVAVTAGVGVLNPAPLPDALWRLELRDPANPTGMFGLVPHLTDFQRVKDTRIGYVYVAKDGALRVRGAGTATAPTIAAAEITGVFPPVPPTAYDDPVSVDENVRLKLILLLRDYVRGELRGRDTMKLAQNA